MDDKNIDLNPDIFLEGKDVNLIVLNERIIEISNWYNWFNNKNLNKYTNYHIYPNTLELQKEFFNNNIHGSKNKIQLGIYHINDSFLIGVISLNNINYFNRSCELSGIIGESKYHNLKYYVEAAKIIVNHAFQSLGMIRVEGGTLSKDINDMVCRLLGFSSEGVKRSCVFKNGEFRDVYLHSILFSEYKSSKIYNDKI